MTNPKDKIGASKPDLSLIPPAALVHEAMAMADGGRKYGPYNWREEPVQAMTYIAAALRHLGQYLDGQDIDPKSLVHHLGHARACCGILLDAAECGALIDNRPKPGKAQEIIDRLTQPIEVLRRHCVPAPAPAAPVPYAPEYGPTCGEQREIELTEKILTAEKIGYCLTVYYRRRKFWLKRESLWWCAREDVKEPGDWRTGPTALEALAAAFQ